MAALPPRDRNDNPYGGGGGVGGKHRKTPFRRSTQAKPYDRPPSATQINNVNDNSNGSGNGWLSRLVVDPAQRLIAHSAHKLFSSVFRKRLPQPQPRSEPELEKPQPLDSAEYKGVDDGHPEAVHTKQCEKPLDSLGTRAGSVSTGDNPSNSLEKGGVTDLELILRQKTFTRSEIDHLTAILHSKILNDGEGETKSAFMPSRAGGSLDRKEDLLDTSIKDDRSGIYMFSTPIPSSSVLEEHVASPAELAKAYMGSRPSKVSLSRFGMHIPESKKESPVLVNHSFPSKSESTVVPPRSTGHTEILENGFLTPRSRGRSAIYGMARTPYSRAQSTMTQGGGISVYNHGGPSSSLSALHPSVFSGPKQGGIKRRSSFLENELGSVGPIRRIRQKSNLLPASGSRSIIGTSFHSGASLRPSSSKKPALAGESSTHYGGNNNHVPGSTSVPSKSSEMASKILQQLDVLVSPREKSPTKLSPPVLRGPAPNSLGSTKFVENVQGNHKLDAEHDRFLPHAQESPSPDQDKVAVNRTNKLISGIDQLAPAANGADIASSVKNKATDAQTAVATRNVFTQPTPQKKQSFQISAYELDNDYYPNGTTTSVEFAGGNERIHSVSSEDKTSTVAATLDVKSAAFSKVNLPVSSMSNQNVGGTVSDDSPVVVEKSSSSAFSSAPFPSMAFQRPIVGNQTTLMSEKAVFSKDTLPAVPAFKFGENGVSSKKRIGSSLTSSSSVGGTAALIVGASSDPKPEISNGFAPVAIAATESALKQSEPDKASNNESLNPGNFSKSSETLGSVSSSTTSIFSFGLINKSSPVSTGTIPSIPSVFSSSSPTISVGGSSSNAIATGDKSASTSAPLFSAAPVTKFVSPVVSSTFPSSVSDTSGSSTSVPVATAGSSAVGGTSLAPTSGRLSTFVDTSPTMSTVGTTAFSFTTAAAANQSQGSNSSSSGNGQTSTAPTSLVTSIQSIPTQVGSSLTSGSFGLNGSTGQSSPSITVAQLSSATPTFGLTSSSHTPGATSISSSSNTSTTVFGSSWQAPKSSAIGSEINSSSTAGFVFGASSASNATTSPSTAPVFSFSSSASATPSQPAFGKLAPTSTFVSSPSGNSDQMNMEDSMAEDTVPGSTPAASLSNQQPNTIPSSCFIFGSTNVSGANPLGATTPLSSSPFGATTPLSSSPFGGIAPSSANPFGVATPSGVNPFAASNPPLATPFGSTQSGASPFQFSSQSNTGTPNPSTFQASSSVDFNAGGSFSLGTGGGGDKSNRKIVKVKRTQRRR